MWRISIIFGCFFFAYFDFVFYEPLKHDTYSPYISLIICIIFYYPLAIFWAITFENPSINEEMAAIWNYAPILVIDLAHSDNFKSEPFIDGFSWNVTTLIAPQIATTNKNIKFESFE